MSIERAGSAPIRGLVDLPSALAAWLAYDRRIAEGIKMTATKRGLEHLAGDLSQSWAELHNQARTVEYNCQHAFEQALQLNTMIDNHLQLINDSLAKLLADEESI